MWRWEWKVHSEKEKIKSEKEKIKKEKEEAPTPSAFL